MAGRLQLSRSYEIPSRGPRNINRPAWLNHVEQQTDTGEVVPLHIWCADHADIRGDITHYDGVNGRVVLKNPNDVVAPVLTGDASKFNGHWYMAHEQPIAVSGAADNGSGEVRLTVATTANMTTGDNRKVNGIVGTTEANLTTGTGWPITVIDGTHIDLDGSTFANAYVSGGYVEPGHGGLRFRDSRFTDSLSIMLAFEVVAAQDALSIAEFLLWSVNTVDGTSNVTQVTRTATSKLLWQLRSGLSCTSTSDIGVGTHYAVLTYDAADLELKLYLNGTLERTVADTVPDGITYDAANQWFLGANDGASTGWSGNLLALAIFSGNVAKAGNSFLTSLHTYLAADYT